MSKSANPKGKGRARDEEEEEDLHMSGDEDRQPAHKNGNGTAALDDDDDDEDDEDDADLSEGEKQRRQEEKDRGERKRVRSMYRKLQSRVDDARGDLQNTTVDSLTDQVTNANALFDKVNRPSEAILDSRVLIATSEAGALKARQLKIDGDAFDTDEFLIRLRRFMGGGARSSARSLRRKRTRRGTGARRRGTAAAAAADSDAQSESEEEEEDEDDDDDDDDRPMKWVKVGRVLAGQSLRAPPLDFMYGPLAIEVKEKKARTQRAKNQWEAEQVRPEELRAEDVAKNANETGKVTARIAKRLREVGGNTGLPYLKFVVNPTSFSQTTENLFYFSFLVREQKAAVEVDEDPDSPFFGDMICFAVDAEALDGANAAGAAAPPPKNQVVLELTEQIWRDAIDLYALEGEESIIPTREAFVPPVATGKYKW